MRLTNLGTESDGEWNGKPVRITETWASDDLAATLLEIRSDPRKQMEDITILTNIKREEPAHSLFEIPPGYKINPTPDEMPFRWPKTAATQSQPIPKSKQHGTSSRNASDRINKNWEGISVNSRRR